MSTLRAKIAEAAQELYLREGIEGVSMRKIAEMVGVSAPAIYRHYQNKDELLNEIVVEGLKVLESYLQPALDAPNAYERLLRLTERYLEFALEQPKFFDFAFLTPSREIQHFADEVARPMWTIFRMAIEQISTCMEDGLLAKGDALETAIVIWAEVHGLVTLYRTGRFGPQPEFFRHIYGNSVRRVLEGLKPRP